MGVWAAHAGSGQRACRGGSMASSALRSPAVPRCSKRVMISAGPEGELRLQETVGPGHQAGQQGPQVPHGLMPSTRLMTLLPGSS